MTLEERRARMTRRRRIRYDDKKPFIELFKAPFHYLLKVGTIGKELRWLLRNGTEIDIQTMTYLDFRLPGKGQIDDGSYCTLNQIHSCLRKLLDKTGSRGTRYGKAMVFRYLTHGHSHISGSESSLQSAVYKAV